MLTKYAQTPVPEKREKKRVSKMKKKLANLLISEKINQMRQEMNQIQLLDETLEKMKYEQRNIQS